MPQQQQPQQANGTRVLDSVPFFVIILGAVHVLAIVYWVYKLASQKQPTRRKTQ